jgi:hypothetical protein
MAATLLTSMVPLAVYFISGRWFVRGNRRRRGERVARMSSLSIRGLEIVLGKTPIIEGLDLDIEEGRIRGAARALGLRQVHRCCTALPVCSTSTRAKWRSPAST